MRIVCVAGARPNFVKLKPTVQALEAGGAEVTIVHSGQHYDAAMSDVFFADLDLRPPDHFLASGAGSHATQTASVMVAIEPVLEGIDPDTVVVFGDVNTTLAAALVAAKLDYPVAHVEAGLRSRDLTMPEELNRMVTDCVSRVLLAPSPDAVDNLLAEGRGPADVHLVGNVMADTLLANLDRALARPIHQELGIDSGNYGLVTLHRPANVDDPAVLRQLLDTLGMVARSCPLLLVAHPRTAERLPDGVPPGVTTIPAVGYLDFIALEAGARVVLTDSGGVQEETTMLGIPCLTLRDNTERPITVTEGTNTVVGRDPERILREARRVLSEGVEARRPTLWDGHAAPRVAEILLRQPS